MKKKTTIEVQFTSPHTLQIKVSRVRRQTHDTEFSFDQCHKHSQREFNSTWALHKISYALIFTICSKRLDKKLVELGRRVACLPEPTLIQATVIAKLCRNWFPPRESQYRGPLKNAECVLGARNTWFYPVLIGDYRSQRVLTVGWILNKYSDWSRLNPFTPWEA